ncbi:MAG: MFS transporter [Thermoleophilaceae bacterium]|nr:MFS transporter [Thermoleophilaceae bacterium]
MFRQFLRPRAAVTAVFFLNGLVFSSWYSRLPDIQDRLDLGTGELGLALLGAPVGLLIAQPLTGALAATVGPRRLVAAAPIWLAAGVAPALAVDAPTLALGTLAVGAANGVLDVAMNVEGLAVERAGHKRIFNSLHAAFSFGALAGAAIGGLAASAELDPLPHLAIVVTFGAAAATLASRGLPPAAAEPPTAGSRFARPSRRLAALGVVAFCALLAEGAVFDWSGIFIRRETDAAVGLAPAGLAAFNLAMGFGRLSADHISEQLGSAQLVRAGALIAAAGLGAALLLATPAGAVAGFAVMGLGLAAVFPLALRAAGYDPATAGPSVAAVSSVGYAGLLTGPPAIGLLAEVLGLGGALACVCGLLALAAALAGNLSTHARGAA